MLQMGLSPNEGHKKLCGVFNHSINYVEEQFPFNDNIAKLSHKYLLCLVLFIIFSKLSNQLLEVFHNKKKLNT